MSVYELLRFAALDVGPYFGVFVILAVVIYWQQKMIMTMFEISKQLNGCHTKDHPVSEVPPSPDGEGRGDGAE